MKKLRRVKQIFKTKKSLYHKVEKIMCSFNIIKNEMYNLVNYYYDKTGDIKPFITGRNLYYIITGNKTLPYHDQNIQQILNNIRNAQIINQKVKTDIINIACEIIRRELKSVVGKWKKGQKASLPKQKNFNDLFTYSLEIPKRMIKDLRKRKRKPENAILITIQKGIYIKLKIDKKFPNINCITIIWKRDIGVYFNIIYEINQEDIALNKDNWISIDLGINNFASIVSNHIDSIIISGKNLKSFNQWYNKLYAKLQTKGNDKLRRILTDYRKRRIKMFYHNTANKIIDICLDNNIGKIIIGNPTTLFQKKSKYSKKSNQNIRMVNLGKFINILRYKCEQFGIEFHIVSENYTSVLSSITENITTFTYEYLKSIYSKLKKNRIKRGLFKDHKINKVFNADLNGALNIAKQIITNLHKLIQEQLDIYIDKISRANKLVIYF